MSKKELRNQSPSQDERLRMVHTQTREAKPVSRDVREAKSVLIEYSVAKHVLKGSRKDEPVSKELKRLNLSQDNLELKNMSKEN